MRSVVFPKDAFFLLHVLTSASSEGGGIYPWPDTSASAPSAPGSIAHVANAFKMSFS